MKYLIIISYDGSKYHGLQKLKNVPTVQGELENILSKIDECPVKVASAGRTDKGVHAFKQVCTFELKKDINPYKLKGVLNTQSSPYLFVKHCLYLDKEDFHPRYDVVSKTYTYLINIGPYDPILNDYVYNYNKKLNLKLMKKASKLLLGPHNFKAFIVGKHKSYNTIIDSIKIISQKNTIKISITGPAFYTYMVRNIVRILIEVGAKTIDKKMVSLMLQNESKTFEYAPAPACGLYLEDIKY